MIFDWESFDTKDRLKMLSARDAAAAHVAVDEAFARSLAAGAAEPTARARADEAAHRQIPGWKSGIEASLPAGDR